MFKKIAAAALFTTSLFGQFASDREMKLKAELDSQMHLISSDSASSGPTVAGAPYSADETTTTTQTLFDGNRIVHTSTTKVFRDQQGRTRVERNLINIGTQAAGFPSVSIVINDPVAGVHYNLQPENKTAVKIALRRSSPENADLVQKLKLMAEDLQKARAVKANPIPDKAAYEDLGDSNMAGVPVKGTRTSRTIPAGAQGNERDIAIVDERWYSSDLKMNIMTRHSDPRSGETVFQVTNLTRANPDASLFQIPADYQIKDALVVRDAVKE
jgi:hypothetical protein